MLFNRLISATCLACLVSGAALADQIPLNTISTYFNGLKTAQTSFVQINDDGSEATGTLYIKRPGRARFEYDGRDAPRVVAGAGSVVIIDPKSNQPPESYPLKRTPLSIILARKVDLGRADMVVAHEYDGVATIVTAQDPDNPEHGAIDLYFTEDPVALRRWVIHDGSGSATVVNLDSLETGMALPNTLFSVLDRRETSDR